MMINQMLRPNGIAYYLIKLCDILCSTKNKFITYLPSLVEWQMAAKARLLAEEFVQGKKGLVMNYEFGKTNRSYTSDTQWHLFKYL